MWKPVLILLIVSFIGSGNSNLPAVEIKAKETKPSKPKAAPSPSLPTKVVKPKPVESKPAGTAAKSKPAKPPAVPAFLARSQNIAIHLEIQALASALESYKFEFGAYPPDFSDPEKVRTHVLYRWARVTPEEVEKFVALKLNPAQALVFWLQGFVGDPKHPLTGEGVRAAQYNFDKRRLQGDPPVYVQQHGPKMPLLYFSSDSYSTVNYEGKQPYQDDAGKYVKPDSFQILCAGLDGDFGSTEADVRFPSGTGYAPADHDNITNFSTKGTLGDSLK